MITNSIKRQVLSPRHTVFYTSLFLILTVPVLVDLMNGFIAFVIRREFSVGELYRGGMILVLFPFMFYIKNRIYQLYVFTLFFFWIIGNIVWSQLAISTDFMFEFRLFTRFVLQFIILGYLMFVLEHFKIKAEFLMKLLIIYSLIAGFSLIFSFYSGIGVSTYKNEDWGYGVTSFFKAQNDIGLSILLTLPFAMLFFLRRFSFKWLIIVIVIAYSLFIISTRAATLGGAGVIILFIGVTVFYSKKQVKIPLVFKGVLLGVVGLSILIGVPLYIQYLIEQPYLLNKYLALIEDQGARVDLVVVAKKIIGERGLLFNIFGHGDYGFHNEMEQIMYGSRDLTEGGRRAEQDLMDFIGSYGFGLGILILIFPVFCFFKILFHFVVHRKLIDLAFLCSIGLFILHSFTAGHAMGSPTVSTTVVLSYLYILQYGKFNPPKEDFKPIGVSEIS